MLPQAALLTLAEVSMKKASLPSWLEAFSRVLNGKTLPYSHTKHLLASVALDMRWCSSPMATIGSPSIKLFFGILFRQETLHFDEHVVTAPVQQFPKPELLLSSFARIRQTASTSPAIIGVEHIVKTRVDQGEPAAPKALAQLALQPGVRCWTKAPNRRSLSNRSPGLC